MIGNPAREKDLVRLVRTFLHKNKQDDRRIRQHDR
jgi:hypothetical protein